MAVIYASTEEKVTEREAKAALRAQEIATQGIVLLKNDGVLPWKAEEKKIAMFGNGARHTIKGGTGSGDVNSRRFLSVEEAFAQAGFEVTTTSWLDRYDAAIAAAQEAYFGRLREKLAAEGPSIIMEMLNHPFTEPSVVPAKEEELTGAKNAVYVLSRNSGEGADRRPGEGDFSLYREEKELFDQLTEAFESVIVVLNVGGVIDTSYFRSKKEIRALVYMSQLGVNGSQALLDVLQGKVTPSGHLTTTWAKQYSDYPGAAAFSHMNGDLDDEYYNEGIYVGYRYFDTFDIEPAYPFGYGLSYTSFEIAVKEVTVEDKTVTLRAAVTNTGQEYSGRQVVQVYVSAPDGTLEKPYQELAAYGKTKELAPGETQELTLCFGTGQLASYCEACAAWIVEQGTYLLRVGSDSRSTHVAAKLILSEDVTVSKLENKLTPDTELHLLSKEGAVPYTYETEKAETDAAEEIILGAENFSAETVVYRKAAEAWEDNSGLPVVTAEDISEGKATVKDMVAQLTAEQLAEICVGTSRGGWGSTSIIGAASNVVPGAAGDTSSILVEERGVRNLILADGPAGLRLSKRFVADKDNNVIPGTEGYPLPGLDLLFGPKQKPQLPPDAVTYYQYCTAIPIATALAQTWDVDAIAAAGDLVGQEMEEFGVHLWLAPGMNIHRNPLCGRNFEYYSEDPLVSGLCAAADTRGVQRHPGCGTTIKHFACNNQEDNRMHTSAHVSERALREIYLKGFEIAVKEAQPKAVMTSYNLINGIHSANNYDLLTAIARDEWGFAGLVMTDWGTTGDMMNDAQGKKYGNSSAAGCIMAGNDLVMPGRQEDVDEIIRSVGASKEQEGVVCPLTLAELQQCAGRVIACALELG